MGLTKDQILGVFTNKNNKDNAERILKDENRAEEFVRKINKKLENIPVVGHYFADVPTLCLMVIDYVKGNYRGIPLATMVGVVVSLIYFLSPVDIIPDFIPVAGQLDDAAIILFAINAAHNDIAEYREWKNL